MLVWVAGVVLVAGVGLALGKRWIAGGSYHGSPDLGGKVAIVTGANVGIGFETALCLAQHGAQVVLACRNMDKAEAAKRKMEARLREQGRTAMLFVEKLDLNSLQSVREFAARFQAKFPRLDILVNNAGIMGVPKGKTVDGFESHFGVNHLGHFLLTNLLLDRLKASAPSRIVVVSSMAHRMAKVKDEFDPREGYSGVYDWMAVYGYSKLCNIAFAHELDRRLSLFSLSSTS